MFYKPFTTYKSTCQAKYKSRDVAEVADLMENTQDNIPHFYRISIALFVGLLIMSILSLILVINDDTNSCSGLLLTINIVTMIYLAILSITCIVLIA